MRIKLRGSELPFPHFVPACPATDLRGGIFDRGNLTPSTDKYVRISKVERAEGSLPSMLGTRKIDGG